MDTGANPNDFQADYYLAEGSLTYQSHISAIKRKREIPWGRTTFEDRLFEDLVWSDPKAIRGTQPSDRGAGVLFGADITENFCAINAISLVIRSHECMQEGYEVRSTAALPGGCESVCADPAWGGWTRASSTTTTAA